MKSKLPAMWRPDAKAWITRQFSPIRCMKFLLQVRRISSGKMITINMLPVAPADPLCLEEDLVKEFDFIQF